MYLSDKDRAFAVEGAEVVVMRSGGWTRSIVNTGKIAKVLKTQIVLEDGRRFKVSDHEEHGGLSKSYPNFIVAADDPRVAEVENEKIRQQAENRAFEAVSHWRGSKQDLSRMREVIEKMQDLLDTSEPDEEE